MVFFIHVIFLITVFFLSHPIRIRISLIFIAILSRSITFYINSSWFFYLIVLVFLGGVIILIIYIRTLAANEKFISNYTIFNLIPLVILLIFSFIIINYYYCNYILSERISSVISIYEISFYNFLVFLIIYLLLTIVRVVKLVKFETGPLIKRL